MSWWPLVGAVVWCGVMPLAHWRFDQRQQRLREELYPLTPRPIERLPGCVELVVFYAFVAYHLPVVIPASFLVEPSSHFGRRVWFATVALLTGGLYASVPVWAV